MTATLAELNDKLLHGNIGQAAEAAEKLARMQDDLDVDWTFTLCDEFWDDIDEFGADLMEASGTDPRNDKGAATFRTKGSSDLVGHMKQCRKTLRGVIVETAGVRLPYYIDTHDWAYEKAAWTSTANCIGIWDILNYLTILPSWFLPIQLQPFSHAVFVGPLVTVIENMISECALRIQGGINEFLNNALSLNPDVRAWFGSILTAIERDGLNPQALLEMLKTPMYVVRTNPFFDGSPGVAKTVRMESCGTTIRDLTKAYGVDVRVDLWRPGDPQPDRWANLTKPTYVVTVKDRSQISGPTKTVLDSIFRTTVDLGGSLGDIFWPIIRQVQSMPGVYEAPSLGVNFTEPYAIVVAPEPGEDSPLVSCKITDHTPKAWQIIIGGRSPKWAGAPRFNHRGAPARGLHLTQRSDQRDTVVADRLHLHRHRLYWHPVEPARRVPQRRVFRVPDAAALPAPLRHGPDAPQHRGHGADPGAPVQRRGHLHIPRHPVRHPRLHVSAGGSQECPVRPVCVGARHLPRRPHVADLPGARSDHRWIHVGDVHRLRREHPVAIHAA
ncbi:minor tail protein [Mycobacterium phage Che9c]|uniref:Minor tail protein n=1 Tax=Mycobacterium phage Che9c TaxID=2907832 RepID=Q854Y0_9CAUD|nr:minor tail protein [Mycobacterium phage Che9c]AAN12578.1 hypothetical protein PBI_CHE9C_17 [Mycobacterium phage Che9c]